MIDSHCHLAGTEFQADLPDVIERARTAGVSAALVIVAAEDDEECRRADVVTGLWPGVRLSIGVHPHTAGRFGDDPDEAARLVETRVRGKEGTAAIGEIGLDYHYDFAPRDVQQSVFRVQVALARRTGLPIVVHTRQAEADTFGILAEETAQASGCVLHCFTGDRAMAKRALDAGYYLSLAGIVTFPRATELHEVARLVPLDRLLIETDSPFLAPVPYRGKRNEPGHVVLVAEAIARLRGTTPDVVGRAARANFDRLFTPVTATPDTD